MNGQDLNRCLATLARHAPAADGACAWPGASWKALTRAGVLRWSIPPGDGGLGLDPAALLQGYEQLASACLTTCFILSQRDAAVRHLKGRPDLLASLASGKSFATVGLSQLTTSRQHEAPALTVRHVGGKLILNGAIPWVTGARHADHLVIGAVTEEKLQILALLPTAAPGVALGPPLELMALRGSLTAEVKLDNVALDAKEILAGPSERVMTGGKGGAGGLATSCLALGLAGAAITYLAQEARQRADLRDCAVNLEHDRQGLRTEMIVLAQEGGDPDAMAALRARANSLVLRASQAALTAGKGAGFLRDHPAQRWARQALFFLVWSCPRPTAQATLAQLAPPAHAPALLSPS